MWTRLLLVAAVVMGLSYTIAKEQLFAPLRERLGGRETWLGYLVSCPYCLSHWLAFALVPLVGVYPLRVAWPGGVVARLLDWFLSSILVTVVAAFLRVIFFLVDEQQGLARRRIRTEEEEAALERLRRRAAQTALGHHLPDDGDDDEQGDGAPERAH